MTDVFVITTRSGCLPYRGYKGRAAGTFRAGQQLITASILPQGKVPHKTEYQENKDVWGVRTLPHDICCVELLHFMLWEQGAYDVLEST